MPDAVAKLRLIHLSDIHFSNRIAQIGFDPDEYIRNELKIDVHRQCETLGPASAVLVSGDIAYAGKKQSMKARPPS